MYKALVGIMDTYQSQLIISLSEVKELTDRRIFRFSYIDCHDTDGPILLEEMFDGDIKISYDVGSNPSKTQEILILPTHTDEEEILCYLKLLYTKHIPSTDVDFTSFGTRTYSEYLREIME